MLNETYPNQPPERRRRLEAVGLPEVAFGAGSVLAVAGVSGWLGVWVAMLVAGLFLMVGAWRAA
jgi:hypothetical protein